MSSQTLYSDDVLSIYVDSETQTPKYKFSINKHLKMTDDAIISTMLRYFEWEFKYMSNDAIADTLRGIYELVSEKVSFGKLKLLDMIRTADRNWVNTMIWEIILNGEGLAGETRTVKAMKTNAAKPKKR